MEPIYEDDLPAFLEANRLQELQDYLGRGRAFQRWDTGALKEKWISVFKDMVMEMFSENLIIKSDIEAELRLRNEEPPHDQVKEEMAILSQLVKARMAEMSKNELADANDSIVSDLQRLLGKDGRRD